MNKPGKNVWNLSTILSAILGGFFAMALPISGAAQSLNPYSPTPLMAGENRGTLDCMVGPHYWSFKYRKGSGRITVNFTSMGLFGNPQTTTIQVILHASNGQVVQARSLTSRGTVAQLVMPGTFPGPGTAYIELRTQGPCLVRAGGDYTISVSGDGIDFGGASAGARTDPIVGTYSMMIYPPDFNSNETISFHFSPGGTVRATDGHTGTWQVFDPEGMIYTVVVGGHRWSLKLVPGRGLADTSDVSMLVFQAVR